MGISSSRYHDVINRKPRRPPNCTGGAWVSPRDEERRIKLLPMLPGAGDRHDECQSYTGCLTRAAIVGGEAHCPEACREYRAIPEEVRFQTALTVRRESYSSVADYPAW
jgi:hypothetical protein